MRSRPLLVAFSLLLVAGVVRSETRAQTPAGGQTFEVASIKRNMTSTQQGSGLAGPQPGGRYVALGATLRRLVGDAWRGSGGMDVVGGPAWADSYRFDVNAKAEGEPGPAQILLMLRPLLADRFKLKVHTEARERDVYLLVMARSDRKPGNGLQESTPQCAQEALAFFPMLKPGFPPPCGDYRLGADALTARGMTMQGLAGVLGGRVGRLVLDRTTLRGAFDVEIKWTSDGGLAPFPRDSAGRDQLTADGVTLFTALQEQLGLRLEPARAPVDHLVIDYAEQPTAD